jgi:hypothetical protein
MCALRFAAEPRDIGQLYVRSRPGGLTPLDNLIQVTLKSAPPS